MYMAGGCGLRVASIFGYRENLLLCAELSQDGTYILEIL